MSNHVELVLTPSKAQFEQLVRDLDDLREAGAASNTAAICEVVHKAAAEARVPSIERRRAA